MNAKLYEAYMLGDPSKKELDDLTIPCAYANGHCWHKIAVDGAPSKLSRMVRCCLDDWRALTPSDWLPAHLVPPDWMLETWHKVALQEATK